MQPNVPPDAESPRRTRGIPGRRRLAGWRRIAFPLGAILVGLAPFVVLECALRIWDAGARPAEEDPFCGFSSVQPLFELAKDSDVYRTARSRQMFFGQQEFAHKKPERTFRIFGLGGSTVRGRPYETDTSFLKWLEIELNGRDRARHHETVNCGGLSYASYRVATILDEVLRYQPDLIIIATGHNEFLEDRTYRTVKNRSALASWMWERFHSLRTAALARQLYDRLKSEAASDDDAPQLDAEVNARLDSFSGYASYHRDDAWQRDVIEQYEVSVRGMVAACRRARVPLVLVNLGENLRDCPPFKSEHKPGLSAASLQHWQEIFDKATKLEETGLEPALQAYREAESIDDQYALLSYRMARCFDRLGEMDEARLYYTRAKDLDICPLRMLSPMHKRLKRIAADTNTPLVDVQKLFAEASPDGIPGNNLFMDHVHPSIESHQRIARALAARLERMGLVPANEKWDDHRRRLAYRSHFQTLGPAYLANGRRRVAWLEDWACRQRLDAETVPKDARGHLDLGRKRLDYGERQSAWDEIRQAIDDDPRLAEDVLDYAYQLFQGGRGSLAEEILLRLDRQPCAAGLHPEIALVLAQVRGEAGRGDLGLSGLEDSATRRPQDTSVAKSPSPQIPDSAAPSAAHLDDALRQLDEAIRRDPDSSLLLVTRARLHLARQDLDAALEDCTRAIQAAPGDADGYKLRAALSMIRGRNAEAVADLTKAIEIDPANPDVFKARGLAYRELGKSAEAKADFAAAENLADSSASSQ